MRITEKLQIFLVVFPVLNNNNLAKNSSNSFMKLSIDGLKNFYVEIWSKWVKRTNAKGYRHIIYEMTKVWKAKIVLTYEIINDHSVIIDIRFMESISHNVFSIVRIEPMTFETLANKNDVWSAVFFDIPFHTIVL
jgi:hypothetical protein